MMKRFMILTALLLAACSSDSGGRVTPVPPPVGWQFAYGSGANNGTCESFDFPPANLGSVHYCIRQMNLSLGQTLTMRFTLSGDIALAPIQVDDFAPATVHLFMQRVGDDLSCVGTQQQARYWTPAHVNLESPGTFTLSATISPEQWTDCYGQPGSNYQNEFRNTVNNLFAVGFTFGGQKFFGHGVAGSGHFTLESYGTGYAYKRKRHRR